MERQESFNIGIIYVNKALEELTTMWQSYVCYLNESRLIQILVTAQLSFAGCYAILRKHVEIEVLYDKVVKFKALASLAGRERNRVLQSGEVAPELLKDINILQDKIASIEVRNVFGDTSYAYGEEEQALRHLENMYSQKFPEQISFTEISLERVKKVIPDNSIVVEYFFCTTNYGRRQFEAASSDETGIDVFISRKENNCYTLRQITIFDGAAVLADAAEFVTILQAESSNSASIEQIERKEDVRSKLYQSLIRPILAYIKGGDSLYIAPDNDLLNLPFEILYDEDGERLGDYYNVIKIESIRDFLFDNTGYQSVKGSLIIGNPQYEVKKEESGETLKKESQLQKFRLDSDAILQLPFSEIEVQRIGRYSGSIYYSGPTASKKLFLSANKYQNIHIATHGYYDLSEESESIYSSCLLFAGIKNWIESGEISEEYGNGIITADEVSRMNLRSVKLVVLSSCMSGMSEVFGNKGFHGMLGALSAAGVQYVVSHLWTANDFSTAVLMDSFYYQYIVKKQLPPVALRLAKNYLKNVTIGNLKQQKWFDIIEDKKVDSRSRHLMMQFKNCNDLVKPFKSEVYWGGFICYRCN